MPTPTRQLLSQTSYDANGSTTVWDFSFAGGYISQLHVKASTLNKATGLVTQMPLVPANFIGPYQISLTPAIPAGTELTIYRDTPKATPIVNFADRSALTEVSLDTNARQAIFAAAEYSDVATIVVDSVSEITNYAAGAGSSALDAAASAASAAGSAATAASNANALITPYVAAAAASAASAAATQVAINHKYRGALASDPATRTDGTPNQVGDEYFANGSLPKLKKVFNGATWQASDIATANLAATGGSGLVGTIAEGIGAVARTLESKLQEIEKTPEDFGAVGNFISDDATAVENWLNHCALYGVRAKAKNKYLLGRKITVSNIDSLVIEGEGPAVTQFKRADGVVSASFTEMFSLINKIGGGSKVSIRGIHFDGNARGSPVNVNIGSVVGVFQTGEGIVGKDVTISAALPGSLKFSRFMSTFNAAESITGSVSGATATVTTQVNAYVFQQSHCVRFGPVGGNGFASIAVDNCTSNDPTADVFGVGGNGVNTYGDLIFTNLVCSNRNRVRGDVVVTGGYRSLFVNKVNTFSVEIELNAYDAALAHTTLISDVVTEQFDLAAEGSTDATGYPPAKISNVIANQFVFLSNFDADLVNVGFNVKSPIRFVRGKWRFQGGRFTAKAGFVGTELYYFAAAGTNPRQLEFDGTEMSADAGVTGIARYFFDDNSFGSEGTVQSPVIHRNVKFRGATIRSAYFRSGEFEFDGCTHEYAGPAILQSTASAAGVVNELRLIRNRITDAAGFLWEPPISFGAEGMPVKVWMQDNTSSTLGQVIGFTRYDKVAAPHGTATAANAVLAFKLLDRACESIAAPTTGKWLKGQLIWNSAPEPSGKIGWVVTTSGAAGSSAVFKAFGAIDA